MRTSAEVSAQITTTTTHSDRFLVETELMPKQRKPEGACSPSQRFVGVGTRGVVAQPLSVGGQAHRQIADRGGEVGTYICKT